MKHKREEKFKRDVGMENESRRKREKGMVRFNI
jgi:hypothetical protein